eukprot:s2651_g8.t1
MVRGFLLVTGLLVVFGWSAGRLPLFPGDLLALLIVVVLQHCSRIYAGWHNQISPSWRCSHTVGSTAGDRLRWWPQHRTSLWHAVLLFPGGAREACHGPTEKYQLFWPSQTDFVRAAARFNAIIVPFGGVGSADNVRVSERSEMSEKDREGWKKLLSGGGGMSSVSEALAEPPSFSAPVPRLPPASQTSSGFGDRFYFSFGKPVDLAEVDPKDKDACEEIYAKLKGDVEREISWLLENRVKDPNRDFVRRQTLEQVMNLDPRPREAEVVSLGSTEGRHFVNMGRQLFASFSILWND